MHSIIDEIIQGKKADILKSKSHLSEEGIIQEFKTLKRKIRSLKSAIQGKKNLSLIAEVKRASPSRGIIRKDFNPAEIAKIYQEHNAAAISILTEERYFRGSLSHLRDVRSVVSLPVLRKDFILDTYQIFESYIAGADAVLLIVKIMPLGMLSRLYNLTKSLGMEVLMEIHSEAELESALKIDADIIGINNRNLDDFMVQEDTTRELAPLIPKNKVVVSESGINSNRDIEYLRTLEIDAVLIGEAFLKEPDLAAAIRNIWY